MDILVLPDGHTLPGQNNDRYSWLSQYIIDTKPDCIVDMGDGCDFASLAPYDKGKRSFVGKSYKNDVNHYLEAQDRLWSPIRSRKKKLPYRVVLEGNHEHRIEKALDLSPELTGTLQYDDLENHYWYDEIVKYEGSLPGSIQIEGVTFAHYLTSGILGKPISGEHPAYSLLSKLAAPVVVAHSHTTDYCIRTDVHGKKLQAIVAGCYFDYDSPWAGRQVNQMYWRGVIRLHDVHDGTFDPEWISLNSLKKEYGNVQRHGGA